MSYAIMFIGAAFTAAGLLICMQGILTYMERPNG